MEYFQILVPSRRKSLIESLNSTMKATKNNFLNSEIKVKYSYNYLVNLVSKMFK